MRRDDGQSCRICGASLEFWNRAFETRIDDPAAFDYYECTGCGCLQIAAVPSDLDRYYSESYYTRGDRRKEGKDPLPILRGAWTDLRLRLGSRARWIAGRRYARFDWFTRTATGRHDAILDVGCGSGRLLGNLRRDGFTNLTGIDPLLACPETSDDGLRLLRVSLDEFAARRGAAGRGSAATTASALSNPRPEGYSLVMSHHSFEHFADPRRAFARLVDLVRPGGWLLLRVPLASSWARRHYGIDWVQLDAPRHLHLPTQRSVARLAADHGLVTADVVDDSGPFQISGSERLRRRRQVAKGQRRSFADSLRARIAGSTSIARLRARSIRADGSGDQACFYLRKPAREEHVEPPPAFGKRECPRPATSGRGPAT